MHGSRSRGGKIAPCVILKVKALASSEVVRTPSHAGASDRSVEGKKDWSRPNVCRCTAPYSMHALHMICLRRGSLSFIVDELSTSLNARLLFSPLKNAAINIVWTDVFGPQIKPNQ